MSNQDHSGAPNSVAESLRLDANLELALDELLDVELSDAETPDTAPETETSLPEVMADLRALGYRPDRIGRKIARHARRAARQHRDQPEAVAAGKRIRAALVVAALLACVSFGLYWIGRSPEPPPPSSLARLQEACGQSSAEDCEMLGAWYSTGTNVEVNLERAAHYYELACDLDLGSACFHLGELYEPEGLEGDYEPRAAPDRVYPPDTSGTRRQYFERACALGYEPACEALRRDPPPLQFRP